VTVAEPLCGSSNAMLSCREYAPALQLQCFILRRIVERSLHRGEVGRRTRVIMIVLIIHFYNHERKEHRILCTKLQVHYSHNVWESPGVGLSLYNLSLPTFKTYFDSRLSHVEAFDSSPFVVPITFAYDNLDGSSVTRMRIQFLIVGTLVSLEPWNAE
jgi:hypothetical protein